MYEAMNTNHTARQLKHARSHSLKPPSSQPLVKHRSKRTLSLPARGKPFVIPPLIAIDPSDEPCSECSEEEENGFQEYEISWYSPALGFSLSVFLYFWSCVLSIYSRSQQGT